MSDALFGWQRRGLVLVAVPVDRPAQVVPEPRRLTLRDVAQMIACPVCLARVDQMCRTTTGRTRAPHSERLIPKRCPCGEPIPAGKKVCQDCRAAARRENGRRGMRNTRARRRALSTDPVQTGLPSTPATQPGCDAPEREAS